jgi:hypothetical protein
MNKKRLSKIKRKMDDLRARSAGIRSRELVSIAISLGRRRSKRGKEPTYVSEPFPHLRPLSIPSHSKPLKRFTASSILDQLEEDVAEWEDALQ